MGVTTIVITLYVNRDSISQHVGLIYEKENIDTGLIIILTLLQAKLCFSLNNVNELIIIIQC